MVSKSGRTTDFSKEEKLLMTAFRENFQKQKCKDTTTKRCKYSTLKILRIPEAADSNPRENMISKVVEQEKLGEEKLVIIRRKEAKDSQECSNFLLVYVKLLGNDRECSFRFVIVLETLWLSASSKYRNTK